MRMSEFIDEWERIKERHGAHYDPTVVFIAPAHYSGMPDHKKIGEPEIKVGIDRVSIRLVDGNYEWYGDQTRSTSK